jgi:TonB-linked SusC/RagA family outer membrane protein
LSLADSRLANEGPSTWKNPITSALLKPSLMAPYARDEESGAILDYLDDSDEIFNVSNPKAIVRNAAGTNRNYHFLSSMTAQYRINDHFNLYTLVGINFNNTRENIFLPDIGLVQVDSAYNSPGDLVYEFRSTQNNTKIIYNNKTITGHNINFIAGFRYLDNSYKYNLSKDLNTPSDDFKSLGRGAQFTYLRSTVGDNRGLKWISYYGVLNYNFRNKYYINANIAYDGNSAVNEDNRYNLYPSVGAAWRVSSENFMSGVEFIKDLKFRGSYSITGNMYNTIYDYSKLYYTDRRMNAKGTLVREAIPNNDMELEKRATINGGVDLSLFQKQFNVHLDVFNAKVDNMVILQELPSAMGYTNYYDNGGKLEMSGIELSADFRMQISKVAWQLGGSLGNTTTKVKSLEFITPGVNNIITSIEGAQFITSEDNPINAFYGYKTDGLLSAAEAGVIGPNGVAMQEGDIKYVGGGDGIIDESDKTIIGDPNPELFGGFFTSFTYKRFQLMASFNYSIGNDIYNYVRAQMEGMDSYANQSVSVIDRWKTGGAGSTLPRESFGDPTGNTVFSDRWIEDGTYLRLGQLSLSYDIPPIPGVAKGLSVYLTATNLFTITNYSGYDPDFAYMNSPFYMGVDYGKMPQTKSFVMGLKIDL